MPCKCRLSVGLAGSPSLTFSALCASPRGRSGGEYLLCDLVLLFFHFFAGNESF